MMGEKKRILIRGARVIDPLSGLDEKTDILIEDGKIEAVTPMPDVDDAQIMDAEGLAAAPGLVDMHVHFRDPGQTHKEDILTGCAAAAAGGVTSVAAMPNTRPVCDSTRWVRYMIDKAAQTGVRLYPVAAVTKELAGEELVDFNELANAGAVAFSDDGKPVKTAALMARAMLKARQAGRIVISHCEDGSLAGGLVNEGAFSEMLGIRSIPAAAEDVQVAREIALSAAYGLPVHIAHVSTAGSVQLIRDAKRRGVAVTAETCPHYFALDESLLASRDADYRMNPPLRTADDRTAVIEGIRDGTIDVIVTDHAPHARDEKSDFEKAPNGVVGLETSLAAGITYLVKPGYLTLPLLLAKMTFVPAGILGIRAGSLKRGNPADIVLFDPEEEWRVEPEKLHSKSKNTPFKGIQLTGRVRETICDGRTVYRRNFS